MYLKSCHETNFVFLHIRQVGRSFSNLSEKVIALGLARVLSVFLVLSLFISDISSFSASREDLRDYRRISAFCFIIPHLRPKEKQKRRRIIKNISCKDEWFPLRRRVLGHPEANALPATSGDGS